ncbi:MAG: aminotransferase class V-fold PLP-dependent enzyme [Saprospiraceae bacterium]|nr:aminotransferase class V-fold PLP-dependent enzyme [Saprospiraceae bacterium]
MIDQILQYQAKSKNLEPTATEISQMNDQIIHFALGFIQQLDQLKAYRPIPDMKGRMEDPEKVESLDQILQQLKTDMTDIGLNPASGGHLGYIPGGGLYAGAMGDLLAAITNQYAGIFYGGPGAVKMENELIRWLCQLVGFPKTSLGNLTSGGSIANLIAFVTAREAKKVKSAKIPHQCIYLTTQVHHCVHKAIRICGLEEANIRYIRMNDEFRMDTGELEAKIKEDIRTGLSPFMMVGSAGTTDAGAVDPLNEMATIAEKYGIWFHVDAAYGGFFCLSELPRPDKLKVHDLFKGIERADSLAIDPHKGMFLSYGLGAVLIKDIDSQYKAHYYRASYMQDNVQSQDEPNPADLSPELTKHFRGLRLWLPLKLYGKEVFVNALNEKILLCRYFYSEVQQLGFQTGPYPDLSVCIYRYVPENMDTQLFNQKLVSFVVNDGRVFVTSTTIDGTFWIRLAVLSFRTHLYHIETLLSVLKMGCKTLLEK